VTPVGPSEVDGEPDSVVKLTMRRSQLVPGSQRIWEILVAFADADPMAATSPLSTNERSPDAHGSAPSSVGTVVEVVEEAAAAVDDVTDGSDPSGVHAATSTAMTARVAQRRMAPRYR
jgi:hypothetical protein